MSRARRRTDDPHLGYRRVDDPLLTESLRQSLGDLEGATVRSDVFTKTKDIRVALHLLEERLANRLEVSDLCHQSFSRARRVSLAAPFVAE